MNRLTWHRVLLWAVLLLFAAWFLVPLYVMLTTSLKDAEQLRTGHLLSLPTDPSFAAWAKAWGTDYLATEPLIGALSEPFQKFMPDDAGQPVNLRAGDGIHFAPAGLHRIKQALLNHLEQEIRP